MRLTSFHRNRRRGRGVLLGLGVVAALVLAACGDSSNEDESSEAVSATSEVVQTSPTTTVSEPVEPLMTMVWDGAAAAYIGPETIEGDRQFDIRLVNDTERDVVDFVFGRIDPEWNVTEEDEIAWDETETGVPPWVDGNVGHFAMHVRAGETIDTKGLLLGGYRYELVVWIVTGQYSDFAAFIETVPSQD